MKLLGRIRDPARQAAWIVEPFLHVQWDRLYNPLTDRTLPAGTALHAALVSLRADARKASRLAPQLRAALVEEGWLVEEGKDLARRYYLKYVDFEGHTACNQACYFCPVSVRPRPVSEMPLDLYERIAAQLAGYRATLEGIFVFRYNEPTLDKRFLERIDVLKRYDLPIGLNTNGTGLTPARVEALHARGGVGYLSVNLSTLDPVRYRADRGHDHVALVLRHLDYVVRHPIAPRMEIAVLGPGDETHARDVEAITARFAGTPFLVKKGVVMDRAGHLEVGRKPLQPHARLAGCEQTGSRPLQWLHITPQGTCVLCCEDYDESYVVGDLTVETVEEVLTGDRMAQLRRWAYGLDEAPADFICRKCVFARTPQ